MYNTLLNAQKTLQSKREQEAKLTASGKVDKVPLVQDEIHDVSCSCSCHDNVVTFGGNFSGKRKRRAVRKLLICAQRS